MFRPIPSEAVPDDRPAHARAALTGTPELVHVAGGRLLLGTCRAVHPGSTGGACGPGGWW